MLKPFFYFTILTLFFRNVHAQNDTSYSVALGLKEIINEFHRTQFDSIANELNLPKLKATSDGLSVRLWANNMYERDLYVLSQSNNDCTAQKYIAWGGRKFKQEKISTKATAISIIDSLKSFQLKDIPDQNEIKGMVFTVDDGVKYTLEIATKSDYYMWVYENPEIYSQIYPENRKFYKIIQLVKGYFNAK